jgi:hypothetical protein
MKNILKLTAVIAMVIIASCKKEKTENPSAVTTTTSYLSVKDFLSRNKAKNQVFTVNGSTGGSFTSSQGTVVSIPPNAFLTFSGVPVTGNVRIEFKDIYKKSEMLLSDIPTQTLSGNMLKSGGEFLINASFNNQDVMLDAGKKITVTQPVQEGTGVADQGMVPFVAEQDSIGFGWWPNPNDSIFVTTEEYIFSLYSFSSSGSGTWCNSDNQAFFNAFPQTLLTLHGNDSPDVYLTEVFLVFSNINSMIHVYRNYGTNDFPYNYAPVGLQCTMVALGAKDGKLYSSFRPITITANQTVNFSLTETTDAAFKAQLNALN